MCASGTDTGGTGVPVVFLHAATGSSRVWEHQIPAFTARSYRLIAYDRRGFGKTVIEATGPQPGSGADDLLALVNQLGIERFHLVGTAAGAFVALDFALSFPQRLRTLVIANSIGGVQDEDYLEASTSRSRPCSCPGSAITARSRRRYALAQEMGSSVRTQRHPSANHVANR